MMTRRRRGFVGGFIKRPREPLVWARIRCASKNGESIFQTAQAITLFDPTTEIAGGVDERLTIRRIMVDGLLSVTLTGGANPSGFVVGLGVAVLQRDVTAFPDPTLAAARDTEADWLWLKHSAGAQLAASPVLEVATTALTRNTQNQTGLLDIRAQRKLTNDQKVFFIAEFRMATGSINAATITAELWASVLYQRTMRR